MMNFNGKTAVITGGATGIGFALAMQFGRAGSRVIIAEPREAVLVEAVQSLTGLGIDAKYCVCDVAQASSVEALADFAWAENGRADILVNNAGVPGPRGGILDMELQGARDLFDVNYFGAWNGIQSFGRRYRDDGLPAAIYTTASENALFNALPGGNGGAYVSSKHAVLALMDVFRREVETTGALANLALGVIIPGWVATPMTRGMGMDADMFAAKIFAQMEAGEYYLVGHSYNMVRIAERQAGIAAAYARYAPRYEGDDEFDVQLFAARAMTARSE